MLVYINKWLSIHPSATDISLCFSISPVSVASKSLPVILKSYKINDHLLFGDFKDPTLASVSPQIKLSWWNVESE